MNYPDDFNVPTFAAGKSIAASRAMAVGIMSAFLIIVFVCVILVWTIRSVHVEPYILLTGGINDQWQIIKPGGEQPETNMTGNQIIQQALIWKFAQQWFSVLPDMDESIWNTSCKRVECDDSDISGNCALFCITDSALFNRFKDDILPEYKKLVAAGKYWIPDVNSISIVPVGTIDDYGGTWRVQMSITTGKNDSMEILAYAKVAHDIKTYTNPKTLGYYIADFNAYRMK